MPDAWKILLGAAAFSAVFNIIFWALEKKEIFLGVLHIAVQKVRMTGQAAEAVSLCLKMPQGDMLAAALGKGASEGAAALFSGCRGSSSFSWALPPRFPKNCCFAAFYLSCRVWRSHFSGRHLDRRHFSGWCMETGRRGFMRRSWDLYWRGCRKKEPSVGTCVISQCSKFDGDADAGASLALVRT